MDAAKIIIGNIAVDVSRKDVKNIHLSVYPPNGAVRVTVPLDVATDVLRVFIASKMRWIKQQQETLKAQEREPLRECVERESHYYFGKRYLLNVIENRPRAKVELQHSKITLHAPMGANEQKKRSIIEEWYRKNLKEHISVLIKKWEGIMGVSVAGTVVQKMKTKWGSCTPERRTLRINLELAKKPPECLEYVIIHEMSHLFERTHNKKFVSIISKHFPKWELVRKQLNQLPLGV